MSFKSWLKYPLLGPFGKPLGPKAQKEIAAYDQKIAKAKERIKLLKMKRALSLRIHRYLGD